MTATLRLVRYSETYLEKSWDWLQDPETKALTMTPDFGRDDQRRFFDSLADRRDYRIWGVELTGEGPIGAAGLKHIDGKSAEYWGYIGEKAYWGQGLGQQILTAIEMKAAAMNIEQLYLAVDRENVRAVSLYNRSGYVADDPEASPLRMTKALQA